QLLPEEGATGSGPQAGLHGAFLARLTGCGHLASRMTTQERFLVRAAAIANVVLMTGAAASMLVFLYFFYHYTWTADRQFSAPTGWLVYYGVPLAIAIVLCAVLGLKRDYRINLAIVCVVLVLSVCAGEFVLQLVEPALFRPSLPVMAALGASEAKEKMAAKLA